MSDNQRMVEWYQEQLPIMFSDQDFSRFFADSNQNIMKYSDLSNLSNINEILPSDGYKIILIESQKNTGHWTCLIRVDDNLIFFDSYGIYPDNELNFVSRLTNKLLGNKYATIRDLMKSSNLNLFYSKTKFQKELPHIATCGRWCCIAIQMLYQLRYSLGDMKRILDKQVKRENKPYDLLAVDYTS